MFVFISQKTHFELAWSHVDVWRAQQTLSQLLAWVVARHNVLRFLWAKCSIYLSTAKTARLFENSKEFGLKKKSCLLYDTARVLQWRFRRSHTYDVTRGRNSWSRLVNGAPRVASRLRQYSTSFTLLLTQLDTKVSDPTRASRDAQVLFGAKLPEWLRERRRKEKLLQVSRWRSKVSIKKKKADPVKRCLAFCNVRWTSLSRLQSSKFLLSHAYVGAS